MGVIAPPHLSESQKKVWEEENKEDIEKFRRAGRDKTYNQSPSKILNKSMTPEQLAAAEQQHSTGEVQRWYNKGGQIAKSKMQLTQTNPLFEHLLQSVPDSVIEHKATAKYAQSIAAHKLNPAEKQSILHPRSNTPQPPLHVVEAFESIKSKKGLTAGELVNEMRAKKIPLRYQYAYTLNRSPEARQTERDLVFGTPQVLGAIGKRYDQLEGIVPHARMGGVRLAMNKTRLTRYELLMNDDSILTEPPQASKIYSRQGVTRPTISRVDSFTHILGWGSRIKQNIQRESIFDTDTFSSWVKQKRKDEIRKKQLPLAEEVARGAGHRIKDLGLKESVSKVGEGVALGTGVEWLGRAGTALAQQWAKKAGAKKIIGRVAGAIPGVNVLLGVGYTTYAGAKAVAKSDNPYELGYNIADDALLMVGAGAGVKGGKKIYDTTIPPKPKPTLLQSRTILQNKMAMRVTTGKLRGQAYSENLIIDNVPQLTNRGVFKQARGHAKVGNQLVKISEIQGTDRGTKFSTTQVKILNKKRKAIDTSYYDSSNFPLRTEIIDKHNKHKIIAEMIDKSRNVGTRLIHAQSTRDQLSMINSGSNKLLIGESISMSRVQKQTFKPRASSRVDIRLSEQIAVGKYSSATELLGIKKTTPRLVFGSGRIRGKTTRYKGNIGEPKFKFIDIDTLASSRSSFLTKLQKPGLKTRSKIYEVGETNTIITDLIPKSKPRHHAIRYSRTRSILGDKHASIGTTKIQIQQPKIQIPPYKNKFSVDTSRFPYAFENSVRARGRALARVLPSQNRFKDVFQNQKRKMILPVIPRLFQTPNVRIQPRVDVGLVQYKIPKTKQIKTTWFDTSSPLDSSLPFPKPPFGFGGNFPKPPPPRPPSPPPNPFILPDMLLSSSKGKKSGMSKFDSRYVASVEAAVLNIRGKASKSATLSGLGIRPLQI